MASRLDRLFILLDQGSTPLTRKAAAIQLGEIQKLHPDEYKVLLNRLKKYLYSNSWDTRIAANQAVEQIIKNIPWTLQNFDCDLNFSNHPSIEKIEVGRLWFDNFCLNNIIKNGKEIFSDQDNDLNKKEDEKDFENKLNKRKLIVQDYFKLNKCKKINLDKLFLEEDTLNEINPTIKTENLTKDNCDILDLKPDSEMNNIIEHNNLNLVEDKNHIVKRVKVEDKNFFLNEQEWPLQQFSYELMNDLFSSNWNIRHGAASALRDLVKIHGIYAGRVSRKKCLQMTNLNQIWLVDLALRLISILALDKFGDYLSDQVVAPVRETCAQALGSIFNILNTELIEKLLIILISLLKCSEWEARHGGLLSLKYLLAVRLDLARQLLPIAFEPIFTCLKDEVDDVSAVAASALVPVKDKLIEILPKKILIIIEYLWNSLVDIDELTSSTSSILLLLSSLLAQQSDRNNKTLNTLIPRLWPFLNHSLSNVRKSVLDAFIILISKDNDWMEVQLLSDSLRLIFQHILIEHSNEIQKILYKAWFFLVTKSSLDNLLNASCQFLSGWICLTMYPSRVPIDSQTSPVWLVYKSTNSNEESSKNYSSKKFFIGGFDSIECASAIKDESITNARLQACKFLSLLCYYLVKCKTPEPLSPLECISNLLYNHLNSKSAVQRINSSWILQGWANLCKENNEKDFQLLSFIVSKCTFCLQEIIFYDEIASLFTKVQHETRNFIQLMKNNKMTIDENDFKTNSVYGFQQISKLLEEVYPESVKNVKLKSKILDNLEVNKKKLSRSLETLTKLQNNLSLSVSAALSCALVAWNYFPEKFNPIIRPLMDSIKREENEQMQLCSAVHLTLLLDNCLIKNPKPIPKIIKNLVNFLCLDSNFTPEIKACDPEETSASATCSKAKLVNTHEFNSEDIIALINIQKVFDFKPVRKGSSSLLKFVPEEVLDFSMNNDETMKENELIRRGASFTLIEIFKYYEDDLPSKMSPLWQIITSIPELIETCDSNLESAQKLLQSLQTLEITLPYLSNNLKNELTNLLKSLGKCLESNYSQIRHLASRCFAVFANVLLNETMSLVLTYVINLLESTEFSIKRKGAIEAFYFLIEKLGIKIVPYIVLIVVPMIGRMSDQNDSVRLLATQCFAQLVRLMPLDNRDETDQFLSDEFIDKKKQQYEFLEQLLNPQKLMQYELPIPIKVDLRSYQKSGVNWLAFLNKYCLHGILCDEMGLGKTLMSICMIAADHYYRKESEKSNIPSLVICPSTLTGHWCYEVAKFVDSKYLKAFNYIKCRFDRNLVKSQLNLKNVNNLVVVSYDILRNDIEFFSSISWNYCVLDEGHIIKNGKTKLSKAIKSLSANHRLILTGTPIQNNVLELWSLFDFLMPGYLGTEKQFVGKYSKPILASRDSKASSKEQESGIFAMESLHSQVLPFILRRMKDDVLKDLPPKIIQDYSCELSALQNKLYEDFSKSIAKQSLESTIVKQKSDSQNNQVHNHIFQALQYLRKVCNHPKLVLQPNHPKYEQIKKNLSEQNSTLSDINNSAKLCALRQLLWDCGIGTQSSDANLNEPVVNQHRALIFFQMKSMLEIVENDLLRKEMPNVTFLRLDGSVPVNDRHEIVNKFNDDLSIDVLLLTTHTGGLGLNLTGADTVIFVEHDWNPMKDLQAMDRAHRIGQKKVVNVYRLITTGTLEEKIMGLQKFKLQVANTVISQENSNLKTMGTEQLLDLFQYEQKTKLEDESKESKESSAGKSLMDDLHEIWNEDHYETEYDLSDFIKSLKN